MKVRNYTELRSELTKTMDEVINDHSPIIITRGSKQPVVMMSLEDFNSYEETFYLSRSPANYKRLMKSIDNIKKGNYKKYNLIEE
jgi:antitoxin YefM